MCPLWRIDRIRLIPVMESSPISGSVPAMQVAVVVYDGVFDSGLASILDVPGIGPMSALLAAGLS